MERLTQKYSDGTPFIPNHILATVGMHGIAKRLSAYEDLEEQGVLFQSPCKPGDRAYVLSKENGQWEMYEGTWEIVSVRVLGDGSTEVHGQVSYGIPDPFYGGKKVMPRKMCVGQYSTKFGEVVFLTIDAANAKLKEYV